MPGTTLDDIDFSDIEEKFVNPCVDNWPGSTNNICRYQVHYDDGFDNTLVVDGVPIIDKSKLERLLAKVAKEFSRKGVAIKPEDIFMPWDESTGKSKGCV